MNIGHSIPLQQINDWKESYFAEKATHFKLTQFNVKLFWEKLPLQEKEECLIISNSTLNHYLSHYISMLEYNYFRVFYIFLTYIKTLIFLRFIMKKTINISITMKAFQYFKFLILENINSYSRAKNCQKK